MPFEHSAPSGPDAAPRRLHPFTLLFSALGVARGFLVPAVLGGASAAGDDIGRTIGWTLAFLSVPALLYAVAKYAIFRYRLAGDELVLDSGVLSRRRRVIPLRRIQTLAVRRRFLHRACGVAELRIETAAGGEQAEAVLSVLGADEARALRGELLARRRELTGRREERRPEPGAVLARLSLADLVLAGATANEAGLLAAVLAGALELFEDLPIGLPPLPADPSRVLPDAAGAAIVLGIVALVAAVVVLGWLLSIGATVVGYHGFTVERAEGELRKRYGLLGRRESTAPLERVQAIRVEESLLRRPLGLATLKIETAGAAQNEDRRGGAEAFVPLARTGDVSRLVEAVFPELDYDGLEFRPVHPRSRWRASVRYAVAIAATAAALAGLLGPHWLALLALLPAAVVAARWQYRHRGYALGPDHSAARAGVWNRVTRIIPDGKVQTLSVRETPFQRRHRLATLAIDTAAGGRRSEAQVLDLGRETAAGLMDRLTARVIARARR